jgi:AcrR family transcriptional regulator
MRTESNGVIYLDPPSARDCGANGPQRAITRRREKERLTARDRREQLLRAASTQFAKTGLHATTTAALAGAAGVSEPTLYAHFPDKESMFQEVVRRNSEARIRALQVRMTSIVAGRPRECIEAMLEAAVSVCLSVDGGPLVTSWGLLELPEFSADLHRQEIGLVSMLCEEGFATRFPNERRMPTLTAYLISCAIQACYSYGLWLGTLHHTNETAGPLIKQFAAGAADSSLTLIRAERRRTARSTQAIR